MDLVSTVRKEGSRGGRGDFKWSEVQTSQHRENYLGHSLMAPVGRWQKNKDLNWYAKAEDDNTGDSELSPEEQAAKERREEILRVKQAEKEALSKVLGYEINEDGPLGIGGPGSGANAMAVSSRLEDQKPNDRDRDGKRKERSKERNKERRHDRRHHHSRRKRSRSRSRENRREKRGNGDDRRREEYEDGIRYLRHDDGRSYDRSSRHEPERDYRDRHSRYDKRKESYRDRDFRRGSRSPRRARSHEGDTDNNGRDSIRRRSRSRSRSRDYEMKRSYSRRSRSP